ncbi:MAG: hypothetical protein KIT83_00535 [Bryobacterales bacterium]|nr:hypothetical protein [Bryobacterales bacterium]
MSPRWLALGLSVVLLPPFAGAQDPLKPFRYSGSAFAHGTVGACAHGVAFGGVGGGVEGLVWKGLSLGAAGSANTFVRGPNIYLLTGQVGYHFVDRNRPRGSDPFVSFGMGFGTSLHGRSSGSANLGGGLNYWVSNHVGIRMEGRVIGITSDGIGVLQLGVAFR